MEVYCDNCNATKINLKKEYWHCGACDFDLCSACYTKKTQPNLFSAFAGSSSKKQKLNPEEEEKSELQSVGDTLFNVGQSQFGELEIHVAGQEDAAMIQEHSLMMEQQPSSGNLNPKALEEKEKQQMLELMVKYGMAAETVGQSKTSSVILFGKE